MGEQQHVRLRYCDDESGHGTIIEPGIVRIDNIPYTDRLNLDDLVEVEAGDDGPMTVKRVLKRSYPHKTAVDYPAPHRDTFAKLFEAWRAAGLRCEGVFAGLALVAHQKDIDPVKVAQQAGITVTLHDTQPSLEPLEP